MAEHSRGRELARPPDEESEYEETMSGDYLKAAAATLAATRRMVAEGAPAQAG